MLLQGASNFDDGGITQEQANSMAMFFANAMPMLSCLTRGTASFLFGVRNNNIYIQYNLVNRTRLIQYTLVSRIRLIRTLFRSPSKPSNT